MGLTFYSTYAWRYGGCIGLVYDMVGSEQAWALFGLAWGDVMLDESSIQTYLYGVVERIKISLSIKLTRMGCILPDQWFSF